MNGKQTYSERKKKRRRKKRTVGEEKKMKKIEIFGRFTCMLP